MDETTTPKRRTKVGRTVDTLGRLTLDEIDAVAARLYADKPRLFGLLRDSLQALPPSPLGDTDDNPGSAV